MSFIESVGGTFIVWLRSDVIPYILFGTCSVVIIVSCLLNIFLIFMLKRRKLILLPTNRYLLQLIIVDFLACGFALIPSCVTALAKSWIMSEPVCYIHAVMSTWLMLVSFGLVCFCLIERAVKQKNPKLHHAVFDSNLGVSITSVMIWAIDLGVAILPVFGISHIAYDVYQASCVVFHSSSLIYVTTVFSLTFVVSLLIFLVTSCLIFNHHRNELKKKKSDMIELLKPSREQDNTVTSPQITNRSEKSTVSTTGIVPAVEETPRDISARRDTLAEMTMSDQETANNRSRYWRKLQNSTKHRPSRLQSVVSAVQSYDLFSDDHKDEDHHLAVTYMIVYCFLSICWLPSLILALANGFDDSIWRGWYSLTMIFAVLSFIAKPIIYMAHNRHFRQNSKMALPESVTVKVARIRNSISTAVDKLDKAVFVSPKTENNFATAVATNKAAKTWIKKVRKPDNTPIIQEECDDNNVVRSESDRGPEETRESQEKDFHPNSADMSEVPIINSPSSSQK
ncbi:G-protein coupled receptor 84-like [Saccostrea echinata]|uniref:G-protein coupled receptor 84-like n=1 Tax=Saccostrea echinata TaxID=191078 RepID=UPI002A82477E|nr:G-protein coupled receptor 84-like [Saccostrea echinata]